MGEYAKYKGQSIKIGTCEDMYYLRADQASLVTPIPNSLDPVRERDALRFRFPFPDEDHIEPGGFANYDRGHAVYGVEAPDIDHYKVQFVAQAGYNVMLPCPESGETPAGLTVHRNGFRGAVRIVQQRYWDGLLVTVCECGGCGSRYRLPTFADAEPIVVALRSDADAERNRYPHPDDHRADWLATMADRIEAGYTAPALAVSTS